MTFTVVDIGHSFLNTYYERMNKDPSKVSALYSNTAELTHINYQIEINKESDIVPTVKLTGKENISKFFTRNNKKVCDLKVKIDSCDIQTTGSSRESIIILTTGELFWTGTPTFRFCQTFVLECIEENKEAFDITNDIIRFIPDIFEQYVAKPVESKSEVNEKTILEDEPTSNSVERSSKELQLIAIKKDTKENVSLLQSTKEAQEVVSTPASISSPVPVKMSWASKLAAIEQKNFQEVSENSKTKISSEKKSTDINRNENTSRNSKKKQTFSTINKDGFFPIYIRGTADVSEDKLRKTLEREFGFIMKMTYADNFAVVDFELQKSQTDALEKKKLRIEDVEVYLERKTVKKATTSAIPIVPSSSSRQSKKFHVKKREQ